MKKLKVEKILTVLIIALLIATISTVASAHTIISPGDLQSNPSNASSAIEDIVGDILGVAQVIGVAVAVIMLIVLAIKYLSASPEGKAEIKKSAMIYIVGAILLFGGVFLLNIIQSFSENLNGGTVTL